MANDAKVMIGVDGKPELRLSRTFDAPKRLVWLAWSKAEYVQRWFAPAPATTPTCEVDLRAGGVFKLVMQMPNGGPQFPMSAKFIEVVKEERLVFEAHIHDNLEVTTTVLFSEKDGKTTLDVHQIFSAMGDPVRGAPQGWGLTLDQLGAFVRELS